MKENRRAVSTIIITGTDQKENKYFQIRTSHLKRFKYYIALFSTSIIVLVGYIVLLSAKSKEEKQAYQELTRELNKLKIQIPALKDTVNVSKKGQIKIENYIESVQEKLKKINTYLQKRGVISSNAPLGGNKNNDDASLSDDEKVKLYNNYLSSLIKDIETTPLGYPHHNNHASGFGYRSNPFLTGESEFHAGVDIKGRTGDVVKSTANGRVITAGWNQGYGKCVVIAHANNYKTLYGHLSEIKVKPGQRVKANDLIGKVGSTGRSTGPHLHYEVRKNNKPLNPALFLKL
ncbi:MAG TPA: peptidoglycan DD-metalloendopeptidase family protein [Sphingobacteriaceae bacterium]